MFNKNLGQNFLKNRLFLKEIANNLNIEEDDTLVEIGGGHGELTKFLLKAKKLIVYEIDKNLANFLKERFANFPNVEIINEDFLKADLKKFNHQYKLVGNIPYRITGLIFRKVLTLENFPRVFVLTLQKEVGEKILKQNSFLSFWLNISFLNQKLIL
jgi:16S rRNA (adenine1518-N6/adenine1519-N6)-dimethyltransferase